MKPQLILTRYVLYGSAGTLSFTIPFGGQIIRAIQASIAVQASATDCLAQLQIGRSSNPAMAVAVGGDQFSEEWAAMIVARNDSGHTANVSQFLNCNFRVTRNIYWHLSLSGAVATAVAFTLFCEV